MTPPPIPTYDPDCEYLGKIAFARTGYGSELIETHLCKNKRCPWVFCETAYKFRECPEQEVMPV